MKCAREDTTSPEVIPASELSVLGATIIETRTFYPVMLARGGMVARMVTGRQSKARRRERESDLAAAQRPTPRGQPLAASHSPLPRSSSCFRLKCITRKNIKPSFNFKQDNFRPQMCEHSVSSATDPSEQNHNHLCSRN